MSEGGGDPDRARPTWRVVGAGTAGRRRPRVCRAVRPRHAPGRGIARPADAVRGVGRGRRALLVGDGQGRADRADPRPGAGRPRGRAGLRLLRGSPRSGERRDGVGGVRPAVAGAGRVVAGRGPRAGRRVVRADAGAASPPGSTRSPSGTRARPSWSSVTAASWCTRCCGGWSIEPLGGRTRAWLDPVNSSLTEWRMAENPMWRSRDRAGALQRPRSPARRPTAPPAPSAVAESDVPRTDG